MTIEDDARKWRDRKRAERIPDHHRTDGRTMDCRGCRYWSEMFAKIEGRGPLKALCLNRNSKSAYLYTAGRDFCDEWAEGEYGAIDDPKNAEAYR